MSQQSLDSAKSEVREMIKAAKYPQAETVATHLLKIHGQDADLLYLRATANARHASAGQAEKDLRAAIALKPRRIDFRLAISNILYNKGEYEEALNEYTLASILAPRHPKVISYGETLGNADGKLAQTAKKLEKKYMQGPPSESLTDKLASLYFVTSVFNWHVRQHKKQLSFYATNRAQINEAEYYLNKLKSLRPLSEAAKEKRNKLHTVIKLSLQRQFDSFIGDWILAGVMIAIGIVANGMLDNWYAVCAAGSIWAFLRPNYLFNRRIEKHSANLKDQFNHIMDVAYGEYITPSIKILDGIDNPEHKSLIAKTLRSLLRATLMPLAVFAGFYKNYSIKHALVFLSVSLGLVFLLSI